MAPQLIHLLMHCTQLIAVSRRFSDVIENPRSRDSICYFSGKGGRSFSALNGFSWICEICWDFLGSPKYATFFKYCVFQSFLE